jgi:hypothetical protein
MIDSLNEYLNSIKFKDNYYYQSRKFDKIMKETYPEYCNNYLNNHKLFLICAYEWYTDRRSYDKKVAKHPYFPDIYESKFQLRLMVFVFLGLFLTTRNFKNKKVYRMDILKFIFIATCWLSFYSIIANEDFTLFRSFYYRNMSGLDVEDYKTLKLSEAEVIKQLRDYNIKLNYKY